MANSHLHKRLSTEATKQILQKYTEKQIDLEAALAQLGIKRSRFFILLSSYRNKPESFSVNYERSSSKRLNKKTEKAISQELQKEKALVESKSLPIKHYNYSAVRDSLKDDHRIEVGLNTIIRRAKEQDCYKARKKSKNSHTSEVLTNYVGELVQHDSSKHRWSPYTDDYWYFITSIDDFSRYLLYADLVRTETSWKHISSLESVCLSYGFPKAYYVDQHSIFRFVGGRDKHSHLYRPKTDAVDPQWKQVIKECNIEPIYALSAQAKGKIERPYQWLQNRTVRQCAKGNISEFEEVRNVIRQEVDRYNNRQVHSTTKEIPVIRFERALKEGRTMLRPFELPKPYKSTKDLFALREQRVVDAYRKIHLFGLDLKMPNTPIRQTVDVRMVPDMKNETVELRFWYRSEFVGTQTVKMTDLKGVQF